VNPYALELLGKHRIDTAGLRAKSSMSSPAPARHRLSLPLDKLDRLALKQKLDEIGKAGTETPA